MYISVKDTFFFLSIYWWHIIYQVWNQTPSLDIFKGIVHFTKGQIPGDLYIHYEKEKPDICNLIKCLVLVCLFVNVLESAFFFTLTGSKINYFSSHLNYGVSHHYHMFVCFLFLFFVWIWCLSTALFSDWRCRKSGPTVYFVFLS